MAGLCSKAVGCLHVRPEIQRTPCIYQLNSMLGCWAAHGDLMSTNECASHATMLFECMRTMVRCKTSEEVPEH